MKMTDDELADKARRQKLLGSEIERIKAERETLSSEIVHELHRRRRASVAAAGVTITLTSRRTGYAVETLRAALSRAAFKRVTVLAADAKAIDAEIKAGTIGKADVAGAEVRSREFPNITVPEAA